MVRKTKISKTFCKMLIIVCIVAILYSLVRSFLFSREGLDNPGLTDFVTGAGNATDRLDLDKPKLCSDYSLWQKKKADSGCVGYAEAKDKGSWFNDPTSCNIFEKNLCLETCKGMWCNPSDGNANPNCDKTNGAYCQHGGLGRAPIN